MLVDLGQSLRIELDLLGVRFNRTNQVGELIGQRFCRFQRGPVFANLVLADEINRATPKTQSALLEAMQERTVTVANTTYPLPCLLYTSRCV